MFVKLLHTKKNLLVYVEKIATRLLYTYARTCRNLFWKYVYVIYAVHHRYASLYFCCAIEPEDNELITLEIIHRYVELLDKYFGSVRIAQDVFDYLRVT